jgi:hypothetical protein
MGFSDVHDAAFPGCGTALCAATAVISRLLGLAVMQSCLPP